MPTEKPTEKRDLIDLIDFTPVEEYAKQQGKNTLDVWFGQIREKPQMMNFNIANPLIFVYLCKHHVKEPADALKVLVLLPDYIDYLSVDEMRIVFKSLKIKNLIEVMNAIKTNPNVINAFLKDRYAADFLIKNWVTFSELQLNLFAQETGANDFVNYIKFKQVAEKDKIEANRKREEAERKKAEEEAEKQRQLEEKQAAAKQKALEEYRKKISQRLKKLAYNLDSLGVWKYTMKLPWYRNPISKDDISGLSPDDPGVKNMFGALVRAQKHVNTPERLAYFNDMLELMSGQFDPKKCLQHVTVADMMAAAGIEDYSDEDKKPARTTEAILRYKKILYAINKYPFIFKDVYGLRYGEHPHSNINIREYSSVQELKEEELAYDRRQLANHYNHKTDEIADKLNYTSRARLLKRAVLRTRRGIIKAKKNIALREFDKEHSER